MTETDAETIQMVSGCKLLYACLMFPDAWRAMIRYKQDPTEKNLEAFEFELHMIMLVRRKANDYDKKLGKRHKRHEYSEWEIWREILC